MPVVPFEITSLAAGFARADGLLRDDGTHLAVEFTVRDIIFGWYRRGPKTVQVPVALVEKVTFEPGTLSSLGLAGGTIVLRAETLVALHGVPGAVGPEVRFRIRKADFAAAKAFVEGLYTSGPK